MALIEAERAKHVHSKVKPVIFTEGRPERAVHYTANNKCRIFLQLFRMDKYAVFLGSERNQHELAKLKGMIGCLDVYTASDLREAAKVFLEAAHLLEARN